MKQITPAAPALRIVRSQKELSKMVNSPEPALVCGGSLEAPLLISRPFLRPPIVADGAVVRVVARDSNRPPTVVIEGDGAIVTAEKTARVICKGDSAVWTKDRAKARMYAGMLFATDFSKSTLFNDAAATLRGHAKAYCRNQSRARCLEHSVAFLYHDSTARRVHRTASTHKMHSGTRVYHDWLRRIDIPERKEAA